MTEHRQRNAIIKWKNSSISKLKLPKISTHCGAVIFHNYSALSNLIWLG